MCIIITCLLDANANGFSFHQLTGAWIESHFDWLIKPWMEILPWNPEMQKFECIAWFGGLSRVIQWGVTSDGWAPYTKCDVRNALICIVGIWHTFSVYATQIIGSNNFNTVLFTFLFQNRKQSTIYIFLEDNKNVCKFLVIYTWNFSNHVSRP